MSLDQYPIFIICRDRVSDLALLVSWLEKVGQEKIYFIDNASTYEPLLDYYKDTPHNVIYMGWNSGHTGIWNVGTLGEILGADQHFVVTDPDIVPTEECPDNALDYFRELSEFYVRKLKQTSCFYGISITYWRVAHRRHRKFNYCHTNCFFATIEASNFCERAKVEQSLRDERKGDRK